jgi:predicted transcriptional regulator
MEQDKKAKALAKTTVLIDKAVVKEAKLLALETDQTVKQIVEDAIREKVRREKVKP